MGTPYKMKGSPMYRNYGIESPVKLTDAERVANLAKHAEKGKNDPNYWKKVKEVTGSKGKTEIKYKGKTY